MPNLEEPHTNYISDSKLKKSTNVRYAIIKHIIDYNLKDGDSILELFGGVGITTGYILDSILPKHILINDCSPACVDELTKKYGFLNNVTIVCKDALTEYSTESMRGYDFIFIDPAAFKLGIASKFEYLLNQIKDLDCKVMFTESGIFKMFFVKLAQRNEERKKHFNNYIEFFKKYNLYTEYIGWSNSSSYILLGRNKDAVPVIEEWKTGDNSWERYLNIYKKKLLV